MDEQAFGRLLEQAGRLSPAQLKQFILAYAEQNEQDSTRIWENSVAVELEDHLVQLGVNQACPACGSAAVVNSGFTPAGVQRRRCQDCGKNFTRFTGTMLERSRFPWDVWVEALRSTLSGDSLVDTRNILEHDFGCFGIDIKTVFSLRHKLIHTMAETAPPKLSGVLQMDETFVRESQKGHNLELVSYLKGEIREPRYGRRPSKLGTMGPEFATVLTAVDSRGYCICKLVALGRAPTDAVIDLYEEHCVDAAYIGSDGNIIYTDACDLLDVPHYVKPSNYNKVLENAGYAFSGAGEDKDERKKRNQMILENLYKGGEIDYIEHREDLSYAEFEKVKYTHGLNLARVNELHSELKLLIEKEMTNVATKYLPDYLGYFMFRRNWKVDHGGRAPVNRKDAEAILKQLLPLKITRTGAELAQVEMTTPKASGRSVQILKEKTETAREITRNKYFKYDAEDVPSFNTRAILLDAPRSHLAQIARAHGIKGYTRLTQWGLAAKIAKLDDIEEIIVGLVMRNRAYEIDEEDVKYMRSLRFRKGSD